MAGSENKGTTRLATLPSDLLDDHAPAFVPGWMAQDKLDKPPPAIHNQAERSHTNQINGGWGNEFRPAKPGWVEEKPRVNENRWDKPGGGPFVERAKPFGAVDDHHHVGGPPGGPPMGGKWREDGDRVLPRREPVPRWANNDDTRWMMGPQGPDNFGGADRWEPKGRGRGGPEPLRHGPHEGYPDRWVNPADAMRPRGDKWGPAEGEHHDPHVDRWGHQPNGPPMGRGAPGFGGAGAGFGEPQLHPMEPGRGRGFAPGRGRGLHPKAGPGGVGSPGAFVHNDKWGPGAPSPGIGRPVPAADGGALGVALGTPQVLGSRTARHLYKKTETVTIFKRLAAARALAIPAEVDREDPSLFAESGQPDVLEVLLGVHQPGTGGEPAAAPTPAPVVDGARPQPKDAAMDSKQGEAQGPNAAESKESQPNDKPAGSDPHDMTSEWVYQDPQGVVQGPFTQADIMDWFEGNFFPPTLPIRSAKDPSTAPFRPLSAMLKIWAGAPIGPPGFIAMPEKEEAKQGASTEPSAISQPVTQPEALVASQPAVSIHPEQPPQPSRPETSRFQHVFAENAATQPPQETKLDQERKVFESPGQPEKAPADSQHPWAQQFQGQPQLSQLHAMGAHAGGRPQEPDHVALQQQQQQQLLSQIQALGMEARPLGHNQFPGQPGNLFNVPQTQQEDFPSIVGFGQQQQQQQPGPHEQQQQRLHAQDPLFIQGLEQGRQILNALTPQLGQGPPLGHGVPHSLYPQQQAPWMQQQQQPHLPQPLLNQQHARQIPQPLLQPGSFDAPFNPWQHDMQQQQQQQHQSHQPPQLHQFLAQIGQGQQAPQHHIQQPISQQQQQQQQHRVVADPIIMSASLLPPGRAPSGSLLPIGQGLDSHGSSSNNQLQQASSGQAPKVADLFPFLQGSSPDAQRSTQQEVQAVPQPLPQVFLGAASTSLPVSEAEAAGSRLAAWSQHPTSDPRTALPEPQVAPVPFEKVKQKQRRAKPIEDLHKTQAYESYEPPAEQQQQPSRSMPPAHQEESRPVETKPAPWAKAAPTAKPGQRSLLDIQREEAERAAAAQAAEAAEAAANRGPAITAAPSGWAKVAGANLPPTYQGNGTDVAMQRAMAASLRDIQEHEERVRRQAQQAQQAQRDTLGANGEPVQPLGGTFADAFREKGLLAPKQAGWANAAAKLAKPAGGLKETQAKELEQQQQRKKAAQQKAAAQAPQKKPADDDEVMFWDYGNPATGGTSMKQNGSATASGQRTNGSAAGSAGSGAAKEKQQPSVSRQPSKPAEDEPFSGTPMSPEFEAWCKEQMVRLQGQDDLTLVRFLLSCSSTGEVAEYITAYLGKSADVSKFTSEFLRRKYAEASGKKVKKGNEGAGAAPKAHPGVTAAGAGGGVPSATGWQKLPAKGKKKKDKGRKMEAGLLGFETGVKYDLLERGDV